MVARTYQLSLVFQTTAVLLHGKGLWGTAMPSPSLPFPSLPLGEGRKWEKGTT